MAADTVTTTDTKKQAKCLAVATPGGAVVDFGKTEPPAAIIAEMTNAAISIPASQPVLALVLARPLPPGENISYRPDAENPNAPQHSCPSLNGAIKGIGPTCGKSLNTNNASNGATSGSKMVIKTSPCSVHPKLWHIDLALYLSCGTAELMRLS